MMLKKLEWQKNIDGDYEAEAFGGHYLMELQACPAVLVSWVFGGTHRTVKNQHQRGFPTFESAQDAAQLDFEKLVCECYEVNHG